jgi:hypothetical protein
MLNHLARLTLWLIALLVAVSLAMHALVAAKSIFLPLGLLVGLVILLRLIWTRTRW